MLQCVAVWVEVDRRARTASSFRVICRHGAVVVRASNTIIVLLDSIIGLFCRISSLL